MSARFRVLLTDRAWPDWEVEREILSAIDAEIVAAPNAEVATLVELSRDVDAIATCWAQVTDAVVAAAENCRVIARFGIGLDNIAVETATGRGIPVTYVPDYCVPEVSEHTLALLLACARKIAFFSNAAKQGRYDLQAGSVMHRLEGRTLGLVGFGRIAQAVFRKGRAFGLDVVATTPSGNDYGTGCRMVSFEELLAISDFISIHAPLTDASRNLFDADAFAAMKAGAILINTSRGPIVDHSALHSALQANEIAGAALDVFDPEPPDLSQPLFADDRVIVTPHAGFLSAESLIELRSRTTQQVVQALRGERPDQVVNPQIYENA